MRVTLVLMVVCWLLHMAWGDIMHGEKEAPGELGGLGSSSRNFAWEFRVLHLLHDLSLIGCRAVLQRAGILASEG